MNTLGQPGIHTFYRRVQTRPLGVLIDAATNWYCSNVQEYDWLPCKVGFCK
jgi:hypothetical protein